MEPLSLHDPQSQSQSHSHQHQHQHQHQHRHQHSQQQHSQQQQHQDQQGPGAAPSTGLGLGAAAGMMSTPPPQQLPPQMFTTAAQLLDLTDKKLMIALRDGRKLVGVLRSWDQFANLVLQSTTERLFYLPPPPTSSKSSPTGVYADIPHGTYLVRGENVLLLGEIDLDKDDDAPPGYVQADLEEVTKLIKGGKGERARFEKRRMEKLRGEGFVGDEELL